MKHIITLTLLITSICSFGQSTPDELVEKFFERYKEDRAVAIKEAFKSNPWIDQDGDAISNLITQLNGLVELVGDYLDYEQLKKRQLGSRFVIYSYLVYYERQPIRFTFELYKSKKEWMYFNIQYDQDFDDELEEANKIYRFKEVSDWPGY
jgi:hypothetical protein